jgi:hypothetical protein
MRMEAIDIQAECYVLRYENLAAPTRLIADLVPRARHAGPSCSRTMKEAAVP